MSQDRREHMVAHHVAESVLTLTQAVLTQSGTSTPTGLYGVELAASFLRRLCARNGLSADDIKAVQAGAKHCAEKMFNEMHPPEKPKEEPIQPLHPTIEPAAARIVDTTFRGIRPNDAFAKEVAAAMEAMKHGR